MDVASGKNIIKSKEVFKDFFHSSYKNMVQYASYFLTDLNVAEDIVQECFINLWKNRRTLDLDEQAGIKYLKQSIKNSCLNHLRHEKVKGRYVNEVIFTSEKHFVLDEEEEYDEKIRALMEKLPEKVKRILELSVVHGLRYSEIAKEEGISINTVKYHIKSAYKSLRNSPELKKII